MSLVELVTDLETNQSWTEKSMREDFCKTQHINQPIEYLLNEKMILQKLEANPYVPKYLGMEHAEGKDYLKLEYIEGITLQNALREYRHATYLKEPRNLFSDVISLGKALLSLEQKNIVHRDLKPENIILHSHATIIDFGIAYDMDREDFLRNDGTVTHGTPMYMSPEQVQGKKLTPASDQFAFSTIVYMMLTRSSIFPEGINSAIGRMAYLVQHAKDHVNGCAQRLLERGYDKSLVEAWALCADPYPKNRKIQPLLDELEQYNEKKKADQESEIQEIEKLMQDVIRAFPDLDESTTNLKIK